ncbi:LysR family transcriptional regulator [Massilia sp. B-10]|nr:LysR family transcriptional regulator [Massilia sp. B-10]
MRLRHIEVFHAIMQVGTISGAAQVLHISQLTVTKVLQHAELQLGMPLFERGARQAGAASRSAPLVR